MRKDKVFGMEALEKLSQACERHEKDKPLHPRGRRSLRKYVLTQDMKDYLKYIYNPDV